MEAKILVGNSQDVEQLEAKLTAALTANWTIQFANAVRINPNVSSDYAIIIYTLTRIG